MIRTGWLRVVRLVATHGRVLSIALLVLAVAAPVAGYATQEDPGTRTVVDHVDRQTVDMAASTSATVTENTSLWTKGTRLEDRSLYLYDATPVFELTVRTDAGGHAVNATQEVALVYRAHYGGESFWTDTRTIARSSGSGERVVTNVSVNVTRVRKRVRELEHELDGAGAVDVAVRVTTTYDMGTYEGRLNASAPLSFTNGGYALGGSLGDERAHSTRVTRTVTESSGPGLLPYFASGGLAALAAVGVAVLAWRTPDLARVEYEIDRAAYAEWISRGTLPDGPADWDGRTVAMASLDDLVNVGIDGRTRVVYDPGRATYAVVDGRTLYYYEDVDAADAAAASETADDADAVGGPYAASLDGRSDPVTDGGAERRPTDETTADAAGEEESR